MTRAYLRLDPHLADNKAEYPDGAFRAFVECLCWAVQQSERGYFRSEKLLRVLLEKRGRWVQFLIEHGDLTEQPDGRIYVDGWAEWQEGDFTVADRMNRIRRGRGLAVAEKSPGARRTANYRLRTNIFERDAYTCRYCGIADYPREWLVMEHVDPNGPTDHTNLVTACRPCNKRKGPRTPEEAGMILRDESHDASRDVSPLPVPPSSGGGGHSANGGGTAPSDGATTFMGYRPRASAADVQRQEDEQWTKCSECGVIGRRHPASGEHKFTPEKLRAVK